MSLGLVFLGLVFLGLVYGIRVKYITKTCITEKNYLAVWTFAKENGINQLLQTCNSFVSKYFVQLIQQDLFLAIPPEYIESFLDLRGNFLLESIFYDCIANWVEYDKDKRSEHFPKLFKLVNLDDIERLDYIAAVVAENGLVKNNLECLQRVTEILKNATKLPPTDGLLMLDNNNGIIFVVARDMLTDTQYEIWTLDKGIQETGVAFRNNILYIIGGHPLRNLNASNALLAVSLDEENTGMSEMASMNQKRSRFGCVLMGNFIYVAGGRAHQKQILDRVECYNIRCNHWTSMPSMKRRREHFCLVRHDNFLYALGGTDLRGAALRDVEKYDGNQWSLIQPMNEPRSNFAALVIDDEIYAIGGLTVGGAITGSVEVYGFENESWRFEATLNHYRRGHSAFVKNEKIYVVGGSDNTCYPVSTEIYGPGQDDWISIESTCYDNRNVVVLR